MAQRGQEWLALMLFEASCTHLTVTTWVEKMLIPTLRSNSLIVFDNAPFYNKPKIKKILELQGHSILPLPRYSPDFNPIEESFAVLKRQRTFSGKTIDDLISSHS
jgi:transposase